MNESAIMQRARRRLKKLGFFVVKSRVRNLDAYNHGGYMIRCAYSGGIVAGEYYNLNPDDVLEFANA